MHFTRKFYKEKTHHFGFSLLKSKFQRKINIGDCVFACRNKKKNCFNHDVGNRVSSENALKMGNSVTEIFDVT